MVVWICVVASLTVPASSIATPPSQQVSEIGDLKAQVSSEADAKKVVRKQQAKWLPLFSKVLVRQAVGGDTSLLSGKIEEKEIATGDAELLIEHMTVQLQINGGKIVVPTKGKVYRVCIPVVAAGSTCLVKDGRVLIKLVPQFGNAAGPKTDKGTFVQTRWDIRYSEVEASSLTFFLGEDGRIYR